MNITMNYSEHHKQGYITLEDRRFNIEIDLDWNELLELKEQLDEVIHLIKEAEENDEKAINTILREGEVE